MLPLIQRLWTEEDGVLAFEWTLAPDAAGDRHRGGVAAARDAIIDELGDTAQVMLAVDQSYHVGFPLQVQRACRRTPARPAIPTLSTR